PERMIHSFDDVLDTDEGWAKFNRHYWLRDYEGFLWFFFSKIFTEPHSTKHVEDGVAWGLHTDQETLIFASTNRFLEEGDVPDLCSRVRCPVLVIHGDRDAISPHSRGAALAEATGGELVTMEGSGHSPHMRDPVKVNLLLREFTAPPRPAGRW